MIGDLPPRMPAHDALSGQPGDDIEYADVQEHDAVCTGRIKLCKFVEVGKGGKIYSYELESGEVVSNEKVIRVIKAPVNKRKEDNEKANFDLLKFMGPDGSQLSITQHFLNSLDCLEMSMALKVAIHCIVKGDVKNLRVASFLISERAGQMQELEALAPDFLKDLMTPHWPPTAAESAATAATAGTNSTNNDFPQGGNS